MRLATTRLFGNGALSYAPRQQQTLMLSPLTPFSRGSLRTYAVDLSNPVHKRIDDVRTPAFNSQHVK